MVSIVVGDISGHWWACSLATPGPSGNPKWNCVCLCCSEPRIISGVEFRHKIPWCRECQRGRQSPKEILLLVASGFRKCSSCRRIQPLTEFALNKNDVTGLQHECRTCCRDSQLRRCHQMSPADYESLLKSQDGGCGRCGEPPEKVGTLAVDHDHKVCDHPQGFSCPACRRGLLCIDCNLFVGSRENKGVTSDPLTQSYLARYQRKLVLCAYGD